MPFPRTYEAIWKMIPHVALKTRVARKVARKAGLRSAQALARIVELSPTDEIFSPFPWQSWWWGHPWFQSTNPIYYGTFASANPPIARRVTQPTGDDPAEGWANPSGIAPIQTGGNDALGNQARNVIYPHGVTWWNHSVGRDVYRLKPPQRTVQKFHFTGYTEFGRPGLAPAISEENSQSGTPVGLSPAFGYDASGAAYVTGATLYDPFPYGEECPLYFWADLEDCDYLHFTVDPIGSLEGLSGASHTTDVTDEFWGTGADFTTGIFEGVDLESEYIVFRLWASDDGGETWTKPYFPTGTDGGNPDNPSPQINRYDENGTKAVNLLSDPDIYSQPYGNVLIPGHGQGMNRFDIWKENMLLKVTLETPRSDVWVKFASIVIEYGQIDQRTPTALVNSEGYWD